MLDAGGGLPHLYRAFERGLLFGGILKCGLVNSPENHPGQSPQSRTDAPIKIFGKAISNQFFAGLIPIERLLPAVGFAGFRCPSVGTLLL